MPLLRHLLQQEPVHQNDEQENPHKVYRTKLITLTPLKNKKLKFENNGSGPCGVCCNTSHPYCLNYYLVTWLCGVSHCHGGWQYKSRAIPASSSNSCSQSVHHVAAASIVSPLGRKLSLSKSCLLQLAPSNTSLLDLGRTNFYWDRPFNRCGDYVKQWSAYLHICLNIICS